ncbi:FAD-dependent oxidoreductase [Corynebacterium sp. P5848]|nr:FAD-dependent oxidoreductase [Corynebacterium marambiense]MCX7542508.1 FAD-dependent oxidoreductase [Corynebacterium marambiense]
MNTPSRPRPSADHHTEVAVVGAGAAGLEAALVLGRQRRRVLLIDSGDYRNARSTGAHMLLGLDGTPPTEIRDRALADISGLDTVIYLRSTVTAAHLDTEDGEGRTEPTVSLTLSDGRRITARRLIIATGQRDVTRDADGVPLINGLDRGHGIWTSHCPYCHGWENRDTNILVVPVPGVPVIRTVYQAL